MKGFLVLMLALVIAFTLSATAAESDAAKLQRLSALMVKGTTPKVKLNAQEKKEVEQLLKIVLPDQSAIGNDKEWSVTFHDMEENDFFSVDLKKKGDKSFNKFMWFHILHQLKAPARYGNEKFEGYGAMGMKDVHYFIQVGKVEIRAVGHAKEYKNDAKIKGMLKAFKLKAIEKL